MASETTVVAVETGRGVPFYTHWVDFLSPLHRLSNPAKRLLALLLARREDISGRVTDDTDADTLLFSADSRKEMCSLLGITMSYFNDILSDLRKCGAVSGKRINPRLIPHGMGCRGACYELVVQFNFGDEKVHEA